MTNTRCFQVSARDGVRLHVETSGSGPPIVFVPGLGYGAWSWYPQLEGLSADHQVVAVDNRGTGRSDKPTGDYSIDLLADDLVRVIESLTTIDGERSAHVVGASMGGYVALTVALRRPDLVRSLVLIASSPGGPNCSRVPEATKARWQAASGLDPADYARATMTLSFSAGWTEQHPDDYDEILRRRLERPTPAHVWAAQFAGCEAFLDRGLGTAVVGRPALLIHGTADRVLPVENASEMLEHLSDAEFLRLPGAGHLCWIEAADQVNSAIASLVERTTNPRR